MSEPSRFVRVSRRIAFLAKKTTKKYKKGKQVSVAYAKRYPRLVKKIQVMLIEQRKVQYDPVLKHQTYGGWTIVAKQRLTHYEIILKLKSLKSRMVADQLARHKVYSSIWENDRGIVRITVNGASGGRRIKAVTHIGYMKRLWKEKHNGYEAFKDYLLNKILGMLRRRGLRLSNAKESLKRIAVLRRWRNQALDNLDHLPDWMKKDELSKVKSLTKLIQKQKTSKQITGGTIRIEKLISM